MRPRLRRWPPRTGLEGRVMAAPGLRVVSDDTEYLTLARVLIATARGDPTQTALGRPLHTALHLLVRLWQAAEIGARMGSASEILIVRALAFQAHAGPTGALAAPARAL